MKRLIPVLVAVLMAFAASADGAKQSRNKSSSSSSSPPSKTAKAKSKTSKLSGTVVAANGRHAGRARVSIRKAGRRRALHPRVNAAGHFSAKLKAGNYIISASKRSLGSGHTTAAFAPGAKATVTVRLSGHARHKHLRHHRHILHHHHHHKKVKIVVPGAKTSTVSAGGGSGTPGQVARPK